MLEIAFSLFVLVVIVLFLLPPTCIFLIVFFVVNSFVQAIDFNFLDINNDGKIDKVQIIYDRGEVNNGN